MIPQNEIDRCFYGISAESYRSSMAEEIAKGCVDCDEKREWALAVHHINHDRATNSKDNLVVVCHVHHAMRHLAPEGDKWICRYSTLTPPDDLARMRKEERDSIHNMGMGEIV
jgi:hypothetical protein